MDNGLDLLLGGTSAPAAPVAAGSTGLDVLMGMPSAAPTTSAAAPVATFGGSKMGGVIQGVRDT